VVWRAHDLLLDRTVAVKLLHAEVAQDPPAAARFRIEASMAAKLTHPNAVIVYDIGRDDGSDYLVMEFVEGGTLAHVLGGGPLAPGTVAGLGAQVARALGAAHYRRLVHRDVKPANVLITTEGDAKVADFGIAQALGTASSRLTAPGQVMGTARYLAPEQLRGETVDGRADVYALGVVLHEALTGDVPFGDGTMAEVASRRLVQSLAPVSEYRSDVPLALDEAIARATQLGPDDRFPDGIAFAAELTRFSTPGSRRELTSRLSGEAVSSPARRDATADLATDHAAHGRRPWLAMSGEDRTDEPTASMASRPTPLASPRPASAGSSRVVAFAGDGEDRVGSAAQDDADAPTEAADPAPAARADAAGVAAPDADPAVGAAAPDADPAVGAAAPDADPSAPLVGAATRSSASDPDAVGAVADDRRRVGGAGVRRPALRLVLVLAVLLGGGVAVAALDRSEEQAPQADQPAGDDRDADGPDASAEVVVDDDEDDEPGDVAPAEIVAGRDHDPFGSGEEHRADIDNAFDGDETTAWQTQGYRGSPELGGLKSGVGLWVDLGDVRQVAEIEVAMAAPGASFTVYAGAAPPDPSAAPESWGRPVAEVGSAEELNRLTLEEPAEGRVWLLWFTSLPEDGSHYRATVSEVRLLSS
jgi:eukaryotic-like serine/threonine-protein kinase